MIDFFEAHPDVHVDRAEYMRLLGYPSGWRLEERALELADAAADWYARFGRPWVYAHEVRTMTADSGSLTLDGVRFATPRLLATLRESHAHSAVLVAVSAGPELEQEAQRLWREGKPDEYFFLEIYGSAVVEHLVTRAGARLCASAEARGMAVLPHYSPGYPGWDIAEQPQLVTLIAGDFAPASPTGSSFPVNVLESGMLQPKKSLLAVFGLTRHVDLVERLTSLIPCQNCSFSPCQYRRAAYNRRADRDDPEIAALANGTSAGAPLKTLDPDAKYTTNVRALQRWTEDRLSIERRRDGSIEALFRYEGTTCTNSGRPLTFHYHVTLGPGEEGFPIRAQVCEPAPGDVGHTAMCRYLTHGDELIEEIQGEQPLHGRPLNDVVVWARPRCASGCYCEPEARQHKWGLVLETIHYALSRHQ